MVVVRVRGATNVWRLGLPYALVYGYALPLLAPAIDVIPLQLDYRRVLSVVTFAALWSALAGLPVSWGVQARRGLGGLRSRTAR